MSDVAIIVGSKSDLATIAKCGEVLDSYGISWEQSVISAHRAPQVLAQYIGEANERGIKVFVAGAGAAAHLPGVIASQTTRPVIGVPLAATPLAGFDSLMSIVQMPPGIPVATVAVGEMGAKNAGHLAAQIIALTDHGVAGKIDEFRAAQAATAELPARATAH